MGLSKEELLKVEFKKDVVGLRKGAPDETEAAGRRTQDGGTQGCL